jgi:hypothetical protein
LHSLTEVSVVPQDFTNLVLDVEREIRHFLFGEAGIEAECE